MADPDSGEADQPTLRADQASPALCSSCGRRMRRDGPLDVCDSCGTRIDAASRTFGRYRMEREIGRGGFGTVWLAWDPVLERRVALKVIRGGDRDEVAQFQREARLAATLAHPNIAAIYDVGEVGPDHYIAMQYVEGETLARLRLTSREALEAGRCAARAVAHAHGQKIIHRDLKPQNIMRDRDGRYFVLDFGLAKSLHPDSSASVSGSIVGTPAYMAPEQAAGTSARERTDVYGLGATLYALITGRPPYPGEQALDVLRRIADEDPPRPRRIVPALEPDVETIILKAMERDPSRRYESADALAQDIDRALAGEAILAHPPSHLYRLKKHLMKRRAIVATATVGLLAAGIALGIAAKNAADKREAQRQAAQKREEALAMMRETAGASLKGALQLRRRGAVDEMKSFLPPLEKAYEHAVAMAPESPEVDYLMGRFHRALNDAPRARAFQDRALSKDPSYVPAAYERAILTFQEHAGLRRVAKYRWVLQDMQRQGDAATGATRNATNEMLEKLEPRLAELRRRMENDFSSLAASGSLGEARALSVQGHLAWMQGHADEARTALKRAREIDPHLEEAWAVEARLELETGHEKEALVRYNDAIETDRGYAPHWEGRADLHFASGEFDKAVDDATRALELDRASWVALSIRGRARKALADGRARENRIDEAVALLRPAIEDFVRAEAQDARYSANPLNTAGARNSLAQLLRKSGKIEEARSQWRLSLEDATRAIALEPDGGLAYIGRATAREGLGDWAVALEDYSAAMERMPTPVTRLKRALARYNRGNELAAAARVDDAAREYAGAVEDFTVLVEAGFEVSTCLHTRAITLRTHGMALSKAGRLDEGRPLFDRALADASRMIEANPTDADLWKLRGIIAMDLGFEHATLRRNAEARPRLESAGADLERALKLGGESWSDRKPVKSMLEAIRTVLASISPRPEKK